MTIDKKKRKHHLDEIQSFVKEFIENYSQPLPKDITDRVFCAIEAHILYLTRYNILVGERKEHQENINQQIGKMVALITGLQVIGECHTPTSKLIKTYSELG